MYKSMPDVAYEAFRKYYGDAGNKEKWKHPGSAADVAYQRLKFHLWMLKEGAKRDVGPGEAVAADEHIAGAARAAHDLLDLEAWYCDLYVAAMMRHSRELQMSDALWNRLAGVEDPLVQKRVPEARRTAESAPPPTPPPAEPPPADAPPADAPPSATQPATQADTAEGG